MLPVPGLSLALGLIYYVVANPVQAVAIRGALDPRSLSGPTCEVRYGWPTFGDCMAALASMPDDPIVGTHQTLAFGPAGFSNLDVALPLVFSSGELCTIQAWNSQC